MKKFILIAIVVTFFQGCAVKDSVLKVSHNQDVNFVGPLSEVKGVQFQTPQISDVRQDKLRIGWKKNGYGHRMASITTDKPVTDLVGEAIFAAFNANNQNISDQGNIKIIGELNTFWFETDINFWTVEFVGDIQVDIKFVNEKSNEVIYESSYSGTYAKKKAGGGEKTWQEIMSLAMDKLIEDISYDENLVEIFDN